MTSLRPLALAAALTIGTALPALAQSFGYVSDPTGTPLNIRIEPGGQVVGAIRNGTQVTIAESRRDEGGRIWVFIRGLDDNRGIGWVYRDFLNC